MKTRNLPRTRPTENNSPNCECSTEVAFIAGIISEGVVPISNVFIDSAAFGVLTNTIRTHGDATLNRTSPTVQTNVAANILPR